MKRLIGLVALAMMLSFGTAVVSFAGDPAPTEKKEKKNPSGPKADEKKDEKKKGDKGGH